VFHAAAAMSFVGTGPTAARERVFSINVGGTRAVLEGAAAAGVRALVATSSANVVLDRELVEVGEEVPYASTFVDWYGESKAEGERLVRAADTPGGLRTVALRPGGIWGPGEGGLMITAFLDQLAAGRFVATLGRPDAVVDNTHVDSLVRAELLAARALRWTPDIVGGQAYFVTDDERLHGTAWFRPLVEGLGHRWPRARIPGRVAYALAWLGEQAYRLGGPEPVLTRIGVLKLDRSSALRVDRARRDLGYAPLWTRDTGLAAARDDHRALYEARRR
jgi:3beta-hydroxy-delta5-steroid dehydrogenase/steroid delta-isomerase